jgi:hypothetical protein
MAEDISIQDLEMVVAYVASCGAVTNRECRKVTGLGYDSSIKIFNGLCSLGTLRKTGTASATKYVLPGSISKAPDTMNDRITLQHLQDVMDYVGRQGAITNREFRGLTHLSYNSAIKVLGVLCTLGMLKKSGTASATKYILPSSGSSTLPRPGYHRKDMP